MKRPYLVPGLLAFAILAACAQKDSPTTGAGGTVAVVDGKPISEAVFQDYVNGISRGEKKVADLKPDERATLLDRLVRAHVLVADAERNGLAKRPDMVAKLELERLSILHQAVMDDFKKEVTVTEEELRKEYDAQVARMEKTRYRASHILVADEAQAKSLIAQVQGGASFDQLAKRFSMDNNSKDKGGDLDWFTVTSATPQFANVVKGMKKGETYATPVKSEFGWHVIRLTDSGDNPVPEFDKVRDGVKNIVESEKFKAKEDALIAKARITKIP